jgi:hypothetical protein
MYRCSHENQESMCFTSREDGEAALPASGGGGRWGSSDGGGAACNIPTKPHVNCIRISMLVNQTRQRTRSWFRIRSSSATGYKHSGETRGVMPPHLAALGSRFRRLSPTLGGLGLFGRGLLLIGGDFGWVPP